jgi:hypothetical protein
MVVRRRILSFNDAEAPNGQIVDFDSTQAQLPHFGAAHREPADSRCSQCKRAHGQSSNCEVPGRRRGHTHASHLKIASAAPLHGRLTSGKGAGGARRDRTADLVNAIHALSQLSYGPFRRLENPTR